MLVNKHRNCALVKFSELSILEYLILEQFGFVYCCYCLFVCECSSQGDVPIWSRTQTDLIREEF